MLILDNGDFVPHHSEDVLIGNIVKVSKDEPLPSDLVLLQTSDEKGKCYVETKNLDGETSLKTKKLASSKFDLQVLSDEELFN